MPTTDHQEPTLALTRDLIACASVTPEDAGCQSLMMARLQQAGFAVESLRFGAVDNFGQHMVHRGRCWSLPDTQMWYPRRHGAMGVRPLHRHRGGT